MKTQSVSVVATLSRPRGRPNGGWEGTTDRTAAEGSTWKKDDPYWQPMQRCDRKAAATAGRGSEPRAGMGRLTDLLQNFENSLFDCRSCLLSIHPCGETMNALTKHCLHSRSTRWIRRLDTVLLPLFKRNGSKIIIQVMAGLVSRSKN